MNILYTGPMKAGKSRSLIATTHELSARGKSWSCFKPHQDTRDGARVITRDTHVESLTASMFSCDLDMLESREWYCVDYVILDEVFMYGEQLFPILQACAKHNKHVIAASLVKDFKNDWFQLGDRTTEHLLAHFDYVYNLSARCDVCGEPAHHTQRLVNGMPSDRHAPVLAIAGVEYQARCKQHHEVIG